MEFKAATNGLEIKVTQCLEYNMGDNVTRQPPQRKHMTNMAQVEGVHLQELVQDG